MKLLMKIGLPLIVALVVLLLLVGSFAKYQYDERAIAEHNYETQAQYHQETLDSIAKSVPVLIAKEREDERSSLEQEQLKKQQFQTQKENKDVQDEYESIKNSKYEYSSVSN